MSGGIDVVFLGTGGSLPTKERGLPSVALRRDGELVLLDCGEGTQRQMMHAGLGFNRPTVILISHLHGDHILGLPGLLQTMSYLEREKPLDLYGPKGLMKFLNLIYKPLGYPANFQVRPKELSPGDEVDRGEYLIRTTLAKHDIPCIAYAIDTRPAESVKRLAKGADLLMHDGGFAEERRPKAQEYYHSTAREAAQLAKAAKVKRLAVVHISAVTRDDSVLLKEARKIFKQTLVPKDFQTLSLKQLK